MKTIILYKSKWGTTKQYAKWIHEKFPESDLVDLDKFNLNKINDYEIVVIGSRTYMGRIQIGKFLASNWNVLKEKIIYLFSVGLIDPEKTESIQSYEMIPEDIRNSLSGYIKLPGKAEMKDLNFLQKALVKKRNVSQKQINKDLVNPIVDFLKRNSGTQNSNED